MWGLLSWLSKSVPGYTYLQIWRLISILMQFNKIFKRIRYDRVHYYLQEFVLFSKYQYVFRPKSSRVFIPICWVMLITACILAPYNRTILFHKYYRNFGIRGIPLQLFRSYLSNQKHSIKIENVQSGLVNSSNGVPHVSVLGRIFFIMYINHLPKSSACYTVLYGVTSFLTWLILLHFSILLKCVFHNPIPPISSFSCLLHVFCGPLRFLWPSPWNSAPYLGHHPHLSSKHSRFHRILLAFDRFSIVSS